MIQLSPSTIYQSESVCTLNFGLRAKSVELGAAKRNVTTPRDNDAIASKLKEMVIIMKKNNIQGHPEKK